MQTIETISRLRAALKAHKAKGKTIAFVPTMGNLHEGHLTLIDTARIRADIVVSSIFVNPTQFGENEDFDKYPRTLQADQDKLVARGCHYLFTPSVDEMYPNGNTLSVHINSEITELHCGASRPGHFAGVATVVSKLLNIVQPDVAIFGQKDYQQLAVIRQMTADLFLPVQILGVETSRESNGLARSSRNQYLTEQQHETAPLLHDTLKKLAHALSKGADEGKAIAAAKATLSAAGFVIDYLNVVDQTTLQPSDHSAQVILAAALLGDTRLIDNLEFFRP
ncbi:pantoate--beta-alanine ligase [Salinibius halmophilus]|uniref:pantoate--beta-alanine ligase n=1 Tax=Salinibius halmophilus TaxID=1853216 RepID=UPI000E670791|nr:pantoate--beta-alanine ligase [Salinibius halmophilus]